MKRTITLLLACLLITTLFACKEKVSTSTDTSKNTTKNTIEEVTTMKNTNIVIDSNDSIKYAFESIYLNGELNDELNGFSSSSDIKKMKVFKSGSYVSEFKSTSSRQDVKLEFYTDTKMRFVNVSNGYAFTLPYTDVTVNYEIAKYRTQMEFGDSILSVSYESSNPYTSLSNPWYTYGSEWLMCHLLDDDYINNNGLERTMEMNYEFTKAHSLGDTTFKEGFDCYFFGVKIKDPNEQIEYPYYNIAIVREINDAKCFTLFVMKSKNNEQELMNSIVTSYSCFASKGTPRNYFYSESATVNPLWSEETLNLFNKLTTTEYVNWGVFSYSIPSSEDSLLPGSGNYDNYLKNSKYMKDTIEKAWNHTFEIYPTYTHLAYGTNYQYFPLSMAKELAGGNGYNDLPVLQFTYQFTTNNNIVSSEVTPMFDIMRGEYDDLFRALAKGIKEYSKPVLFRLNNEMNTDWTSYSGIMTLLDPDIFTMTWKRLYDIFNEEGVNNVIWIWNPIATSCPYSSWGEDLCYFPGTDYVQLLGGTSYEFNNYSQSTAASEIQSFKKLYSALFKKNCNSFSTDWKLIISEFACGSGGATTGVLGRNASVQAEWVKEMFEEMNSANPSDYIKQIRGAVWFNANDYSDNKISNRLQLIARPDSKENYDDLEKTMQAFRQGFIDQDKRLGIER